MVYIFLIIQDYEGDVICTVMTIIILSKRFSYNMIQDTVDPNIMNLESMENHKLFLDQISTMNGICKLLYTCIVHACNIYVIINRNQRFHCTSNCLFSML